MHRPFLLSLWMPALYTGMGIFGIKKKFLGGPHRCLDHHHTYSSASTKNWTVHSSKLLYTEIAGATCNPSTLMFGKDVYVGVRTWYEEFGFVPLSPCKSQMKYAISYFSPNLSSLFPTSRMAKTSPDLAAWRHSPIFFPRSCTMCQGQAALLQ